MNDMHVILTDLHAQFNQVTGTMIHHKKCRGSILNMFPLSVYVLTSIVYNLHKANGETGQF